MGFRTLAIERRSSEVWALLAGVKTEFGKFGDILDRTQKKLQVDNQHEYQDTRRDLASDGIPGQQRVDDRQPVDPICEQPHGQGGATMGK